VTARKRDRLPRAVTADAHGSMGKTGAAGGLLLFLSIGGLYSLYGPIIPTLRAAFGIGTVAAGLALSAHFVGAMAGIVCWVVGESRLGSRRSLLVATGMAIAGAVGFASATRWPPALGAASIIGLGFGALVVGLNRLFATGFGSGSAAMLNVLGASFGCGAIVGPLWLSLVDGRFRLVFLGFALVAAVGLLFVLRVPEIPAPQETVTRPSRGMPKELWGFVAFYVLYVGVESGIGGWEATHLLSRGLTEVGAGNWTSAYWAAITIGRALAAPVALRVAPDRLVLAALLLAIVMLGLAHVSLLTPWAYAASGLALAPIFPTGLAWLHSSLPSARRATAIVIAGAQVGGVVVPPLVGRLVTLASPAVIPTSLLVVAALCLVTGLGLERRRGAL
jgi:FHS family glucose/mannose:H+ symporter-like MFS transporter